ncbi:hypothetical protein ACE1SV_39940 [Streptomyces sennicomposti]
MVLAVAGRLRGRPATGGFVPAALSVAGVALAISGGDGGALVPLSFAGVGGGLALGFSPTAAGVPAAVRPDDAADAGGLSAAVAQLGRLIGAAAFGTLFPGRLESLRGLGAYTSATALSVYLFAPAGTAAGAVAGLVPRRR